MGEGGEERGDRPLGTRLAEEKKEERGRERGTEKQEDMGGGQGP